MALQSANEGLQTETFCLDVDAVPVLNNYHTEMVKALFLTTSLGKKHILPNLSYQVKLSGREPHHFMSTGATEIATLSFTVSVARCS